MKNFKYLFILGFLISCRMIAFGQQHHGQKYFPVDDTLVRQKLEQWQDLKFGLLMHWGTYSQWGIVESWSICPEDYGWCQRTKGSHPDNYFEYVKEYESLKNTFNPVDFNPERWAKAAKDAGMRYVIFTTKHHDGFCMFDTQQTDYKITDSACPFHNNPRANITKEIFKAFRAEGLWTGAYFSKPDWHSPYYWDPCFPPRDRNVNYDPALYPEKWEKFVQYTHNQIMELLTGYGKVDILWLDGGWVKKRSKEQIEASYRDKLQQTKSGFFKTTTVNQDIRMDELVAKARKAQPGIIVVDRAVKGKNQNYLTPENRVPEKALPYPWESCIIAGGGWSWVPHAHYMSPRDVIHLLADIVAKGGNLLLNIAPGPRGQWHNEAYALLKETGKWMHVNSEAIYGTRATAPYREGKICFTRKNKTLYAIYLAGEDEKEMPAEILIKSQKPDKALNITLLGTNAKLKWKKSGEGIAVEIPEKIRKNPPSDYAWVIKIESVIHN